MKKWGRITNETTGACMVGTGSDEEFYRSIGFELLDVEQAYNGAWYLTGCAPLKPTDEEQRQARANAYRDEVDPITSHISRLEDEEQTPEIVSELEVLKAERAAKVAEIKARYPYEGEGA